jgi:L-threonylcarbamoyladenylate synthase
VVKKRPSLPKVLSPDNTIGIRMPDHPLALALLRKIGPLAVTSANISGQANTNTAEEVIEQLNGRVHLILDGGRSSGGVPSTVVDCTAPSLEILREGPVSRKDIDEALD